MNFITLYNHGLIVIPILTDWVLCNQTEPLLSYTWAILTGIAYGLTTYAIYYCRIEFNGTNAIYPGILDWSRPRRSIFSALAVLIFTLAFEILYQLTHYACQLYQKKYGSASGDRLASNNGKKNPTENENNVAEIEALND